MTTFAELCPVWNKAIKDKGIELFEFEKSYDKLSYYYNGNHPDDHINMKNGARCIVGEAYKWNSEYLIVMQTEKSCMMCGLFSIKFMHVENLEQLKKLQDGFIEHWNDTHNKVE